MLRENMDLGFAIRQSFRFLLGVSFLEAGTFFVAFKGNRETQRTPTSISRVRFQKSERPKKRRGVHVSVFDAAAGPRSALSARPGWSADGKWVMSGDADGKLWPRPQEPVGSANNSGFSLGFP